MSMHISRTAARFGLTLVVAAWTAGYSAAAAEGPKPAAPPSAAPASAEPASPERVDKLIRNLGDKDYYVRQRAQEELARLGLEAMGALEAATSNDDPEVASRARYLLRLMHVDWTAEVDPPEVKNCLAGYENMDARSREARMRMLAALPDAKGVAALCRLVRFEKSSQLSKAAAAAMLLHCKSAEPPGAATIEIIHKNLRGCKRPGALWLQTWTRLATDPKTAMTDWDKLVDAELALAKKSPEESSPELVTRLTRFQVTWLKKLGRNDEAVAAISQLAELEPGDSASVDELLEWLIDQKAWKVVDTLTERFAPRFAAEPVLLYAMAQAYAARGEKKRAEETALRALHLNPGKQEDHLVHHYTAARQLRNRGQFAWARREYEHVIGLCAEEEELTVMSRIFLAEMLHEQGQDFDAAAALDKLVRSIDAGKVTEAMLYGREPRDVRSLRLYYSACDWATKNNAAKQRKCLDQALDVNPEDLDVLIACYHLPGQTADYHAKIVALVEKTAVKLHAAIAADPDSPSMYNQYAWLVGNTKGDFDEALRCSRKSLELQPEEGGYYDTLAHVYFGKGDYKNAVKYETKAAQLDPHSGLILTKLALFRKKLEETKK
jgi:tetratricopeptide (TPR) repeat protein